MWVSGWRDHVWSGIDQEWDVIIIGGGITGAGIFREAARSGLRVLLVDARDFASGTSSRSSKLVHGGFRYLKNAQFRLVRQSVRERERLIKQARGLVNPLGFLLVNYAGDPIPAWVFGAGLVFYDLIALKWGHRHYDAYDMREFFQPLAEHGLQGGYRYFDAQTDDARLVLRLIQEAVRDNGIAINYMRVLELTKLNSGQVCGVILEDQSPDGLGRTVEVNAKVVINATGAWADEIRSNIDKPARLRKLRGSHLIFPLDRLPLTRAISFLHPSDGRPVFAFPWEGVALVGTTDVEHKAPLDEEPQISEDEADYLLSGVQYVFPDLNLDFCEVIGSFSGIRPVVDTGKSDPSKESREYILWNENRLLTVAGGKLTTFRLMAYEALVKISPYLSQRFSFDARQPVFSNAEFEPPKSFSLSPSTRLRLLGRHGANAAKVMSCAQRDETDYIAGTPNLWVELRWAARSEAVVHLEDLLLRRLRVGILLPGGAKECLARVRAIAQFELGWNDSRWEREERNYLDLWRVKHHLGDLFNAK